MSFDAYIRRQLTNRDARLRSPGFQAEMLREKKEFKDQLKETGNSVLDFVYTGLGKKVMGGAINSAAKLAFNKKYGLDNLLKDGTKAAFEATGMGMKTMWEMAKTTGKAAKIGIRQLIAR
jgi:hypothetical protein